MKSFLLKTTSSPLYIRVKVKKETRKQETPICIFKKYVFSVYKLKEGYIVSFLYNTIYNILYINMLYTYNKETFRKLLETLPLKRKLLI